MLYYVLFRLRIMGKTMKQRKQLPDVNELVIATVREIFDYGAYVTLDEYNDIRAFLPWSEITTKWVKDIRDVLREGMKVVGKVIRVNKAKMQIDISTKRVYDDERKKKLLEYKQKQKAHKILEIVAQKLNKSIDEAYQQVGWKLEDTYGDIYFTMEKASQEGPQVLREAGVPEEWINALMEEIQKRFETKKVTVTGYVILRSLDGNGVNKIREVLLSMLQQSSNSVEIRIYTVGAPRYRIDVSAEDYKTAEKILMQVVKQAEAIARKLGVQFEFKR
jgi:translation initiation factor 2 subunit 1